MCDVRLPGFFVPPLRLLQPFLLRVECMQPVVLTRLSKVNQQLRHFPSLCRVVFEGVPEVLPENVEVGRSLRLFGPHTGSERSISGK